MRKKLYTATIRSKNGIEYDQKIFTDHEEAERWAEELVRHKGKRLIKLEYKYLIRVEVDVV